MGKTNKKKKEVIVDESDQTTITVLTTKEIKEEIQKIAEVEDRSLSSTCERLIKKHIDVCKKKKLL